MQPKNVSSPQSLYAMFEGQCDRLAIVNLQREISNGDLEHLFNTGCIKRGNRTLGCSNAFSI